MSSKGLYVRGVRGIRQGARAVGVLGWWDHKAHQGRFWCWSRSLLAVYDLPDLVMLDVPWWTFEAADTVREYLGSHPGARVFEWGSGASTVWLSKRAGSVVAIEHDAAWAADVLRLAPANAQVRLVPPSRADASATPVLSAKSGFEGLDFTDYVSAIDQASGLFDLIVIDGRAREACLPHAVRHLAPGGLIVFDNVDRSRYRDAITAEVPPLKVRWTRGLTPCLPYPTRTALLTTSNS